MAHFTNLDTAARQASVGDTISGNLIHWGYGDGDATVEWASESRRTILVRHGNVRQFVNNHRDGARVVMESYIGSEWTVERVLASTSSAYALAAGAAKADEHRF